MRGSSRWLFLGDNEEVWEVLVKLHLERVSWILAGLGNE